MPAGALYDNLDFIWKSSPKPLGCYSELHQVSSKFIALQKPYTLSIKCDWIPENLRDKALIILVGQASGQKSAVGGEYSDGWVTAKTNLLGNFAVAIDKIPPTIIPLSIKEKKMLTNPSKVQFKISDNLSGIKSYRGEIDGNWVLFEYEPKLNTLSYTFDKSRMAFGKSHLLRLVVTDYQGNSNEYKAVIYK